jgi:hypothetical protein
VTRERLGCLVLVIVAVVVGGGSVVLVIAADRAVTETAP